jgi:hypothetical protein
MFCKRNAETMGNISRSKQQTTHNKMAVITNSQGSALGENFLLARHDRKQPPPPPPRGQLRANSQLPAFNHNLKTVSSSSSISLGVMSHTSQEFSDEEFIGISVPSSIAGDDLQSKREKEDHDDDSWEREREALWEQEKERRLTDKSWQASMGVPAISPRRGSRKPPVPVQRRGYSRTVTIQEKHEKHAELEGRMTVESRVERLWARWLCRSFVANPVPHWCSGRDATKLPLPEDVKSSVLIALILGQLLPPSALSPSLVALMTEPKGERKEKWITGKTQGASEKVVNSSRRIIEDALRMLQTHVPDTGKPLPGKS